MTHDQSIQQQQQLRSTKNLKRRRLQLDDGENYGLHDCYSNYHVNEKGNVIQYVLRTIKMVDTRCKQEDSLIQTIAFSLSSSSCCRARFIRFLLFPLSFIIFVTIISYTSNYNISFWSPMYGSVQKRQSSTRRNGSTYIKLDYPLITPSSTTSSLSMPSGKEHFLTNNRRYLVSHYSDINHNNSTTTNTNDSNNSGNHHINFDPIIPGSKLLFTSSSNSDSNSEDESDNQQDNNRKNFNKRKKRQKQVRNKHNETVSNNTIASFSVVVYANNTNNNNNNQHHNNRKKKRQKQSMAEKKNNTMLVDTAILYKSISVANNDDSNDAKQNMNLRKKRPKHAKQNQNQKNQQNLTPTYSIGVRTSTSSSLSLETPVRGDNDRIADHDSIVPRDPKIIGGTPVPDGTYPYYTFTAGSVLCGATLIHPGTSP